MTVWVNEEPFPYREGLTIADVLREKKYTWPLKTVFLGDRRVPKDEWETTVLEDGDRLRVLHLMAGG